MKIILITILILTFGTMIFAQNNAILLADGTADEPKKYDLQPTVKSLKNEEFSAVSLAAREKEVDFKPTTPIPKPKPSKKGFIVIREGFKILDVAEGFFISREHETRAYLYTRWSEKMQRDYQGILILNITNNGTKFTTKAHYVYDFRGDKFIRNVSDLNNNFLSELAIFSELPTENYKQKTVRIIEFSPDGISKFGFVETFSRRENKQKTPKSLDKNKPAKKIFIPPTIRVVKLYADKKLTGNPIFKLEEYKQINDVWKLENQSSSASLQPDNTEYIEIVKPIFPKGIGEK